ncbi:MAG TPA: hypothetical protein PLL53_15520 [Saprospiraceae bacterium]|nr:hypothetical protein [Saprospiraceae bacterium]
MNNSEKELEFYKLMKEEYMKFLTYVEELWRLKLLAIGGVVSFAILNEKILGLLIDSKNIGIDLVSIGVLVIPILAFIIDLKILETALHLKNISSYLENNLNEIAIAKNWEAKNWETGSYRTNRSFLTFFSTIGISLIILILCVFIVSKLKSDWAIYCTIGGVVAFIIGGISIAIFARTLFKKENATPIEVQKDK